jgi:phosphoenolpyruvate---glycerone phosphotransferase subunit DhaK
MKKLINNQNDYARESIEGLALAFPHVLRKLDRWQVVVRCDAPVAKKVGILWQWSSNPGPPEALMVK